MNVMEWINQINGWVWGFEMMLVFLAVGLYLTVRSGFIQFARIGVIFRETLGAIRERTLGSGGEISPFQATMIAMGATIGIGNIVGVTAAILAGGPGAIFWMWIAALVGMATKFAEATLAVHFRRQFADGSVSGGPMYYIARGLGLPWLGGLFAVFAAVAAFGIGNVVQVSAIAGTLETQLHIAPAWTGLLAGLVVAVVLAGGVRRIAYFAQTLVPLMILFYLVLAVAVLALNAAGIWPALRSIFESAFSLQAGFGGAVGVATIEMIKAGVGRGIFSNEAGLGSAAIAHAQAQVDHPVRQGFWGVMEVFIDSIVINTFTALVILSTGAWMAGGTPYEVLGQGFGGIVSAQTLLAVALALFAFTTLISWAFYGEESATFLFGEGIRWPYRLAYVVMAFVGGLGSFTTLIKLSDTMNGLMAIPNLIALLLLGGVVARLTRGFFSGEPWTPPK
ncbi:alanine/glycine:cation symporter family protein [Oceanithermus desulfurans]|uniref:Alanine glycine permease n=2 Tax=Oceanithermus desulfurans TaxID=227924 RepID=A0A511RJB2_9DEIN|nr:amino acid carrier protein [Oceanithermus desulfurans]MBB6029779.1 AGCS family alanine or glycine:cation symporter [Oceanithermus desulfurans]GEM89740.1 alanine glycine permease [Oceanithermus desulfurans NBRC 100063]